MTHYHMDYVPGLFRARWGRDTRLPVIGPAEPIGSDDLFKHPGVIDFDRKARPFEAFDLGDIEVLPVPLKHSRPTLGYVLGHRAGSLAYPIDTPGLPDETLARLSADPPDVMILDCIDPPRQSTPRNHNDLTRALDSIEEIGA